MERELIVVLDFGDPAAQLAARMVRNAKVYCEVLPWNKPIADIRAKHPAGIVAVGGKADFPDEDAPSFNKDIFSLAVPVLTMGAATRALCLADGGRVGDVLIDNALKSVQLPTGGVFEGIASGDKHITRADRITVPKGFTVTAACEGAVLAMTNDAFKCTALQFIPEQNDVDAQRMLSNFAVDVCGCAPTWTMKVFVDEMIARVREQVGGGSALLAMSGGVDSSVCAVLMHKAIGDRLTCLFVDTGLMRKNEAAEVRERFETNMGIRLHMVDASERFYKRLAGVTEPERKRKIIGEEFIRVFEDVAGEIGAVDYLVQGTIYPDVIESGVGSKHVKAHHNVGGLPDVIDFKAIIEPLRELFKDEVRAVGETLGMPQDIVWRQPFPGPGLAVRCLGEVNPEKLEVLREADYIFRDEIAKAGLSRSIWQYFAILTGTNSTGVGADGRLYGHTIALRAINSVDAMTAGVVRLPYDLLERVSARITREVPAVNRVVYDITGKPPATIEWE